MIKYHEEIITDTLIEEIMPLVTDHYEEIALYKDSIKLNIDFDKYRLYEEMGHLSICTVRDDGELIGYAVYVLNHNNHYKDSLQAVQDILYVVPDKRGIRAGFNLIKFSEKVLKRRKVEVIYQHVKIAHDFSPMLKRLDYEHVEHIYAKRIG